MNWVIIGSGKGLSPVRRQAVTWTSADLLSIGLLGIYFSEIGNRNFIILIKENPFKMSSAKMVAILSSVCVCVCGGGGGGGLKMHPFYFGRLGIIWGDLLTMCISDMNIKVTYDLLILVLKTWVYNVAVYSCFFTIFTLCSTSVQYNCSVHNISYIEQSNLSSCLDGRWIGNVPLMTFDKIFPGCPGSNEFHHIGKSLCSVWRWFIWNENISISVTDVHISIPNQANSWNFKPVMLCLIPLYPTNYRMQIANHWPS